MYQNNKDEPDYKRLFLAIFLAAIVLFSWQAMVEWPRRQALAQYTVAKEKKKQESYQQHATKLSAQTVEPEENPNLTRDQRLAATSRVTIKSEKLDGSLSLKGARFDDIRLVQYRTSIEAGSPEVILFSPNGDEQSYFSQIGWVAADNKTRVPDSNSIWKSDKTTLGADDTVKLSWDNGEGVTFKLAITLDKDYMFHVIQQVENHSGHEVTLYPYAYINRAFHESRAQNNAILHEGPLGVMEGVLTEVAYSDLREKKNITHEGVSGWIGITDKYWLTALIPTDEHYKITYSHYIKNGVDRYQTDYLGNSQTVANNATSNYNVRLFAGAKEVTLLDEYAAGNAQQHEPPIPFFDRAVDFGALYFMTKPMFKMLNYFFLATGNFGSAILLLTIVVKLLMYPLANKSYKATSQMRELQPEIAKLRERYFDDQIAMNKEMMALYKREKVNPASGCLPVLIQMPVFFALYKVLFVTIEMRHAQFFGWIRDLSAKDPSNVFTLFGYVDWAAPDWLHLGVLPLLMCMTMVIQMSQQPKPADPMQAKMISYMPYFMLIVFNSMPAGLVLYWTWSNVISIGQQLIITRRYKAHKEKHHHKNAKKHGAAA
jgi:YidC/Oxa1 family membrane protein insertase